MKDMPKLREYIKRLQYWRDTYEKSLDVRPRSQPLEQGGCNLIEFHHAKFDDVEIPGQYVQVSISNCTNLTPISTSIKVTNSSKSLASPQKQSWVEDTVTASAASAWSDQMALHIRSTFKCRPPDTAGGKNV